MADKQKPVFFGIAGTIPPVQVLPLGMARGGDFPPPVDESMFLVVDAYQRSSWRTLPAGGGAPQPQVEVVGPLIPNTLFRHQGNFLGGTQLAIRRHPN